MIEIRISVDGSGNLKSLRAEGHSMSAPQGNNIVCAAVSTQLRSLVRVVESGNGCQGLIKADREGFLELELESTADVRWLAGVTDVLLAGLIEIERDYPGECSLKLIKMS